MRLLFYVLLVKFELLLSMFVVPNVIRVFLIDYALFTHNKRTIPITSVKDEDTISVFTPYTLRPTLSLLLRLPSLLHLLYLA